MRKPALFAFLAVTTCVVHAEIRLPPPRYRLAMNLERAAYAFQLKKKGTLTLNVDHQVTGIGGTPIAVRPHYRTYPRSYHYSVRFRPVSRQDSSTMGLSKQNLSP